MSIETMTDALLNEYLDFDYVEEDETPDPQDPRYIKWAAIKEEQ